MLDISYNPITPEALPSILNMLETNRTLEYLGLAKLSLNDEDVEQIIDKIGKITFPTDQAEAHLAKIK